MNPTNASNKAHKPWKETSSSVSQRVSAQQSRHPTQTFERHAHAQPVWASHPSHPAAALARALERQPKVLEEVVGQAGPAAPEGPKIKQPSSKI